MPESLDTTNRRILVIDDNRAIHDDFRKIFEQRVANASALAESEAALFGLPSQPVPQLQFEVDFASQGAEGAALVGAARLENRPYALAFIDMRMPPGLDGIETSARIWELDPAVQIVICTAYSDHSWEDILGRLGHSDRLMILKKPFDNIEVLQLASALTEKWRLAAAANRRLQDLETLAGRHAAALQVAQAQLSEAREQLAAHTGEMTVAADDVADPAKSAIPTNK
jgi:CheY-like chemotaxis protein